MHQLLKTWPKVKSITEKVGHIYPDYPELLDKLFKYCLNEKDVETKQKYIGFLSELAKKMPDWFKHEAEMAKQSRRHERMKMIQELIYEANI